MKRVDVLIIGAGSRGTGYGDYLAAHPGAGRVVGVAEPRDFFRDQMARRHGLAAKQVARDWTELAAGPKLADAVIIATPDAVHVEPAVAFARRGYHLLLEKPMATNEADCRRLAAEIRRAGVMFAVCHVLRYTPYTRELKELIAAGAVGDVVCVQHLEPVGYWHQAHSFVRGNWRNERESSPLLLAKSCHDTDWIRHVVGRRCEKVSSFGTLKHFRREERPAGAAERCLDCGIEGTCPYSARKIYLGMLARGRTGWPLDVLAADPDRTSIEEALRTGPYGRCVYACDNDVVDNQVVNMLFEGGRTASFTLAAFNEGGHRRTRIFGTRGSLSGDGVQIEQFDFLTDARTTTDTRARDGSLAGGHGGGDEGLMAAFLEAIGSGDASRILSGLDESLESHLMVFAAEQARRENRVVDVQP